MTARTVAAPRALQPVRLTLHNPSPYERGGIVVTPFASIAERMGGWPDGVRVFHERWGMERLELVAQLDRLVPGDRSRDQLVFALAVPLPGAKTDDYSEISGFVTVEPAAAPAVTPGGPSAEPFPTGVKLMSGSLNVFLNTAAHHDDDRQRDRWFGGAVTSVQVDGFEMLDSLAAFFRMPHHPDKRAMQLDRVHIVRPPWDRDVSFDAKLYDKHWRCVNGVPSGKGEPSRTTASGPLRATATIASTEFQFTCRDVDQNERAFACTVYRAVSVFRDRDIIGEHVWVSAVPDGGGDPADLWFSARYFMMVQLALRPITFRYPNHPGWFALNSTELPHNGYAFATDANAGPIWSPPLDYADEHTVHRAYAWELGATRCARTFHLFRNHTSPQALTDVAGWTWYDLAYKPIIAA